jgi:hypothetical protein
LFVVSLGRTEISVTVFLRQRLSMPPRDREALVTMIS